MILNMKTLKLLFRTVLDFGVEIDREKVKHYARSFK